MRKSAARHVENVAGKIGLTHASNLDGRNMCLAGPGLRDGVRDGEGRIRPCRSLRGGIDHPSDARIPREIELADARRRELSSPFVRGNSIRPPRSD